MTDDHPHAPRVLLDVSVLGRAWHLAQARTGVARVAHCIAAELIARLPGQVMLCAGQSLRELVTLTQYLGSGALGAAGAGLLAGRGVGRQLSDALQRIYPSPNAPAALRRAFELSVLAAGAPLRLPDGPTLASADLFHSTYYPFPAHTADRTNPCRLITVYDLIPILHPEYFQGRRQHLIHRVVRSIGPRDWVFAISNSTKDDLCNYMAIDPERVIVTHLAADETFYPRTDPTRMAVLRSRLGISDRPYVLTVGTLEPRKNLERVVRCFFALIEQQGIRDLDLVLVGAKGWDFDGIFRAIKATPELSRRVLTTGFVDDEDLAQLYSGALFFVYPSLYEGFGLPPLEAMQCGVPVITSDRASLPEIVDTAAIQIDPTDDDALADAMHALYSDSALRRFYAAAGRDRSASFSWRRCAEQTIGGYRQAMQYAPTHNGPQAQ